jgi:hypothetical protein
MSTEPRFKFCPECREEYTLVATRCVHCDVELVHGDELAREQGELEAFPPTSELACVRVAPLAWIRALSEALQQSGVIHRVEPATADGAPEDQRPEVFGDVQLFGLYVRSEDVAVAAELDASIAVQVLPEEAPALAEGEEETCPACGTSLAADATECPDCGLQFG